MQLQFFFIKFKSIKNQFYKTIYAICRLERVAAILSFVTLSPNLNLRI